MTLLWKVWKEIFWATVYQFVWLPGEIQDAQWDLILDKHHIFLFNVNMLHKIFGAYLQYDFLFLI